MVMPLVPSYNTQRVYGTWVKQGGTEMRAGTYKVTVPVRVTNATDDVIIPTGTFETGALNTTPGQPSLDIQAPCTDDPDNSPIGWQLHIEVTFTDAPGEKYVINVPAAGPEINLRSVVLSETLPVPKDVLIRGVPGGLAEYDTDGDLIDASGVKVLPGGGGGGTELTSYATQVAALSDYPATFPAASHTHAQSEVTGLSTALAGKADTGHTHTTAQVAGLDTALAGKAPTSHTHATADVTGLDTALAGKAATSHTHTAANISDSTATGRSVLTAADAAAARTAIGAGTSNLAIGTTGTTAKAGNYQPTAANISDSTTTGRALLTAADAAAARTAAGVAYGTTAGTVLQGNWRPGWQDLQGAPANDQIPQAAVNGLATSLGAKATIVAATGTTTSGRIVLVAAAADYPGQVSGGGIAGDVVIVTGA